MKNRSIPQPSRAAAAPHPGAWRPAAEGDGRTPARGVLGRLHALEIGWGATAWIVASLVSRLEPNMLEEGLVLHIAERLLQGDHLYRDIVFYSGPLPFEVLALLFRVFGHDVLVARDAMVVLIGLATAATVALARRASGGLTAHAAGLVMVAAPALLFPLFSTFFYTTLAFYLSVFAAAAALAGLRSPRWAFAAGLLVAAAALSKQNLGAALAAATVPAVALCAPAQTRRRATGALVLGGAAAALATLGWFAVRGDLATFVEAMVVWPLQLGRTYEAPLINFVPIGRLAPEIQANWVLYLSNFYFYEVGLWAEPSFWIIGAHQALYALPFAMLAATALAATTRRLPAPLWLNAAVLLAMTANLFPRADWGHLVFALPPALVQILLLLGTAHPERLGPRLLARGIPLALIVALGAGTIFVLPWLYRESGDPMFGPRVNLRPVSPTFREPGFRRVIGYLLKNTEPGDPIFVARQEPLIYFATQTRNPTPFPGIVPGMRERQEREILDALRDVEYVVMSDIDQPLYTFYGRELPAVWDHLERYFAIPHDFHLDQASWIVVGKRGHDRGPTAIDFVRRRDEGLAWIRDADGREIPIDDDPPDLVSIKFRRPFPIVLGPLGGGIDFEITVPENARFDAGMGPAGMRSQTDVHEHPQRVRHVLRIRRPGGEFEQLHEMRMSEVNRRTAVNWVPFAVSLAPWAGERVTLRIEIDADVPLEERFLGWWGSPRIALPPER